MRVLELFAGTRSIGRAFERRGHDVLSVDWDDRFDGIDLTADVLEVTYRDILDLIGKPDVIWASPDCTTTASRPSATIAGGRITAISQE